MSGKQLVLQMAEKGYDLGAEKKVHKNPEVSEEVQEGWGFHMNVKGSR